MLRLRRTLYFISGQEAGNLSRNLTTWNGYGVLFDLAESWRESGESVKKGFRLVGFMSLTTIDLSIRD